MNKSHDKRLQIALVLEIRMNKKANINRCYTCTEKNSMYLKFRVNIRNLDPIQNHVMGWNNRPLHQQSQRSRHVRNCFQLLTVSPDFGDVEILEVGHLNEKKICIS